MDISVGSYKFRLEILILIVVVFWIMFGHVLCSCCKFSMAEGMQMMKEGLTGTPGRKVAGANVISNNRDYTSTTEGMKMMKEGMSMMKEGLTGTPGRKVAGANVISNNRGYTSTTEGFVSANNVASGPEFAMAKSPDYIMNPSTWASPTLTYSPGTKPDAGVKAIWDRPKQPIPLPKGELDMFATTPFAPECCPNAYSSSTGCACMTVDQYNYLHDRGGNNVPYSDY